MILCIIGPSCAGKTTAAEFVSEQADIQYIEASDFVRERWSEEDHEDGIMGFVKSQFETLGYATFAEDVVAEFQSRSSDNIIICGYRADEELEFTRAQTSQDVVVIGIYANSLLRYQRKLKRDNPDPEYSYRDFVKKDFEEYGFGIQDLLSNNLDYFVINEISMEEFERRLADITNRIF